MSIRLKCVNLRSDVDAVTALVLRRKDEVGKLLSNVSTEVRKAYEDVVDAAKLKIQDGLVLGWEKT